MAPRPDLLVLDEPTSGLDPLGTEEVLRALEKRRDAGAALLLSTHDRETAEGLCERAVVLDRGRVRADGRLADLLRGDGSPSLLGMFRRLRNA